MIHLECDNDEALAMALGVPRSQISHRSGKGRVSKALSDSKRSGDIGMIDQDPGQPPPPYLRQYKIIEQRPELCLVLSKHPIEGKHLIEIQPDLEPWIYALGPRVGIKPSDHRLPPKPYDLRDQAKKQRQHLIAYLQACLAANSPHLTKLAEWLRLA